MIEAWLSSSDTIRVPAAPSAVSTPRLAANPVGNSTARSVPFQSASSASNSRWIGRAPVMSREPPAPVPHRSIAALAASATAGCALSPR